MSIHDFIEKHYRHFNAGALRDAVRAWQVHDDQGGKMFLALGGAMSTAEIGLTLAEMIRRDRIHAICTTGANLEEDIFNLVAHDEYKRIPDFRTLTSKDEEKLRSQGLNRVTDTCIPEEAAMRKIEAKILKKWQQAEKENKKYFHYEFLYQLIKTGELQQDYQIDPKDSWVVAACEKNLPIFTPGWEDSTLGNFFVANKLQGHFDTFDIVKSGPNQMEALISWYQSESKKSPIGFIQVGGGIAGDFAICVVPLIQQDLKKECPLWAYYLQISDSTTSFGSYSGAVPNEKITWGKLDASTPKFMIESDATIVAPLIFQAILERESTDQSASGNNSEIFSST